MLGVPFDERFGLASNSEGQPTINNMWQITSNLLTGRLILRSTLSDRNMWRHADIVDTIESPSQRSRHVNWTLASWCVYEVVLMSRRFRWKPSKESFNHQIDGRRLKKETRQSVMAGTCRPTFVVTSSRQDGLVGNRDSDCVMCATRNVIRTTWRMAILGREKDMQITRWIKIMHRVDVCRTNDDSVWWYGSRWILTVMGNIF